MHNIIVIGSGCAGNTAAIYAARASLEPLVVEGLEAGGQLTLTTDVENFPGFPEGIMGPDLVDRMKQQAQRFGATYKQGEVTRADLSSRPFKLGLGDQALETKTLVVASGASARWLGLDSEQALIGHGVSSCATCDGFFFRGQPVTVVGGGDSAMEEALFLTKFATEVAVVHRREAFRASKIMLDRARANDKIRWITNAAVTAVEDPDARSVKNVRLRSTVDSKEWDHPTNALFLAIGHIPNTKIFRGQLDLDDQGYIVSYGGARTNIPGVFHAGDVQDRVYRQAITAAGAGCMAAIEAERLLESEE
ncbi:MAG: thioredoxin-disulfide reductase [Bryobacterales bacterium]|nr:thioredoxin-disulfide reductase [Bryobacterales bacterium]